MPVYIRPSNPNSQILQIFLFRQQTKSQCATIPKVPAFLFPDGQALHTPVQKGNLSYPRKAKCRSNKIANSKTVSAVYFKATIATIYLLQRHIILRIMEEGAINEFLKGSGSQAIWKRELGENSGQLIVTSWITVTQKLLLC